MKSEKLYDAITEIREDLIARAEREETEIIQKEMVDTGSLCRIGAGTDWKLYAPDR